MTKKKDKDKYNKHYWETDRNYPYKYTTPNQKVIMSVPKIWNLVNLIL